MGRGKHWQVWLHRRPELARLAAVAAADLCRAGKAGPVPLVSTRPGKKEAVPNNVLLSKVGFGEFFRRRTAHRPRRLREPE